MNMTNMQEYVKQRAICLAIVDVMNSFHAHWKRSARLSKVIKQLTGKHRRFAYKVSAVEKAF